MSYSNIGSAFVTTTHYPLFKTHIDIYTYYQDVILPNSAITDKSLALENAIYAAAQDAYESLLKILAAAKKQSQDYELENEMAVFLPLLGGSVKIWCLYLNDGGANWGVIVVMEFEGEGADKRETYKLARGEEFLF